MLFGYHLNLCCGITMLDRLELAQFYIKRPDLRPLIIIAMLGASIQIGVPFVLVFLNSKHLTCRCREVGIFVSQPS
jgi:hypothetical protein